MDLDEFTARGADTHIKDVADDLVPEDPEAKLEDARIIAGNRLVLQYQRNVCAIYCYLYLIPRNDTDTVVCQVKDELYIHNLTSGARLTRVAADHVGALNISGRRDQPWFFVSLTGFTNPGVVARYTFHSQASTDANGRYVIWRETEVQGLAGSRGFIAEQVRGICASGIVAHTEHVIAARALVSILYGA